MNFISVTEGTLDNYLKQISTFPRLTQEEEIEMFNNYHHRNCMNSMYRIITSNLQFVVHVAKQYQGYDIPLRDLIQEGNVGLMHAAKKFDTSMGVRFVTYAVTWIKSNICKYITDNYNLIKFATSKPRRKLFFNKSKVYNRDANEVALELDVPVSDVKDFINYLQPMVFIDDQDEYDDTQYNNDKKIANSLTDYSSSIDALIDSEHTDYLNAGLHTAISQLSDRERDIIQSRILDEEKSTLHDLSIKYNISKERVRQVEADALKKLKNYLSSDLEFDGC